MHFPASIEARICLNRLFIVDDAKADDLFSEVVVLFPCVANAHRGYRNEAVEPDVLVLSRRPDDSIVFPGVGITVHVLSTGNRMTRIGIEAPSNIRIVRKELLDGSSEETLDIDSFAAGMPTSADLHKIRNQLNALNLGLQFFRRQMDAGMVDEANVTFLRVINRLKQIEEDVTKQANAASIAEAAQEANRRIRVLLVEDDAEQRELLAGILQIQGCDVATAPGGEAALRCLKVGPLPNYVLLDMRMPNGDGATTVRALRKMNLATDLKIVATSGSPPAEFGINVGLDGVNHWFPKPINTDRLVAYLRQDEKVVLSTSS